MRRTQAPARQMGRALAWAAVLLLAAGGCAHVAPSLRGSTTAPPPDSITVALWRMDERAGTRVVDSGPFRFEGTAGRATLTQFGRFGLARSFQRSLDSFVYVPGDAALDLSFGLAIEAWIYPRAFGRDEDTPIVGRWTEEDDRQSWLFSLGGDRLQPPVILDPSPGYHLALFTQPAPGYLWFAYRPADASPARAYRSTRPVELERWTHVAVTFDGEEVRLYIDGMLDSQFASHGRIRSSLAPLLIGNYFDPRFLNRFSGDLRPETSADPTPYYAYRGLIDELRISSAARREFSPPDSR